MDTKGDFARNSVGRLRGRSGKPAGKQMTVRNSKMILFVLLFLCLASATKAVTFEDEECLNYTVYPVQYEITIYPYVYKQKTINSYYDCDVVITVIANAPNVNIIELDAKDMNIQNVEVFDKDNRNIINEHRPYEFSENNGKLYIYLKEPLRQYSVFKTQYTIRIRFKKNIYVDSEGIYLAPYEHRGTKYLLVTRLSPNKAKYFFPCFDNPRFEAVFKFKVYIVPEKVGVQFANSSLVAANQQGISDINDNYKVINYLPSPQLTLNQIGFAYDQFDSIHVTSRTTNDSIFIWAQPNKLHQYEYILTFSERMLNFIHEYSTVERPIMDGPINIVAVPANVDGYEIESWKLLTNGETRLAYVSGFTSIRQRERMLFDLTQQLLRIWLGNPGEIERTTWREEWFKEGVATYLAYYLLTQYENGAYNMKVRWPLSIYGLEMKHKAMAIDWHHSTPALSSFNRSLAIEIPSRYKDLVTIKTASLLWMIENWLGYEKFHTAFVKYINSRRGTYISLENFMTNLDLSTVDCQYQFFNGSTASRILNSWFHQSGYPVINVNVLRDRELDAIQLKQHRFSFTHDHRGDSHYLIPISYVVEHNQNCYNCHQPRFTIDSTYTFEENLQGGWIILNRNASGYYRVNYDPVTWRLITQTLKKNRFAIEEMNRAQIVNDVFALYAADELNMDMALEILDYLDQETSPLVWDAAMAGFELLRTENAACNMTKYLYREWEEFMRMKVANIYKLLKDYIEQQPSTHLFKSKIIDFAYSIQHKPCVQDLRSSCKVYRGNQRLEPDIRRTCYYMFLQSNGNFGQQGFNTYEIEDKMTAEHKLARDSRFRYRIPEGQPRPAPLRSTELPATVTSQMSTTPSTPSGDGRGASFCSVASFLTLIAASLILAAVR